MKVKVIKKIHLNCGIYEVGEILEFSNWEEIPEKATLRSFEWFVEKGYMELIQEPSKPSEFLYPIY